MLLKSRGTPLELRGFCRRTIFETRAPNIKAVHNFFKIVNCLSQKKCKAGEGINIDLSKSFFRYAFF